MAAQVTDLDSDYHVLLEPPWGHAGLFLTFCLAWLLVCEQHFLGGSAWLYLDIFGLDAVKILLSSLGYAAHPLLL